MMHLVPAVFTIVLQEATTPHADVVDDLPNNSISFVMVVAPMPIIHVSQVKAITFLAIPNIPAVFPGPTVTC
jgi:hypothetical protein